MLIRLQPFFYMNSIVTSKEGFYDLNFLHNITFVKVGFPLFLELFKESIMAVLILFWFFQGEHYVRGALPNALLDKFIPTII